MRLSGTALHQRLVWAMVVGSLAIATSGCSLLNPYVRADELDRGGTAVAGLPVSELPQNEALLSAITAAAAQRKAYYKAVGERAKLRNGLPLVLIPLSAAAAYKGLSSGGGESTRKLLLKEGLVGAGIFGLASYYTSTTREQIYLAGAKALSCSIYAMTAYYLPDSLGQRLGTPEIEALSRQLGEVERKTHEMRAYKRTIPTAQTGVHDDIAGLISRAETSIAAARKVLRQTVQTQALVDGAAARLRAAVENVIAEVDAQIARSEPDPATILTIAGSLAATAKQFAPGASFTAAAAGPPKSPAVGIASDSDRLLALGREVNTLDTMVAALQFALDVIGQRLNATPALETCQVQGVQGRIEIAPDEPVEMKVGDTRQFVVRSTAGIPSIEWVGPISAQVELTRIPAGETIVVQIAYKAAVEGVSQMVLQVAAKELKRQVVINLLPGSGQAPKKADAADGGATKAGSTVDEDKNTSRDGAAAKDACRLGPQNAFENALPKEKLQALQAKLKVPPTGAFDAATRSAIRQWQVENKSALRNCVLQPPTFNAIMK